MQKTRLLYFGSSKGIGLTYHLAVAAKYLSQLPNIDFTLVSGGREQFPGLFDHLIVNSVKFNNIRGIDEVKNFMKCIRSFLKYIDTEQINIVHAQTNAQLLYCIVAKVLYRTKIVYTIHSFRNGKSKFRSTVMSFFLSFILNIFANRVISLSTLVQTHFNRYKLKSASIPLGFEYFREPNAIKTSVINIIYPATFNSGKRHVWLINSLVPFLKLHSDVFVYLPGKGETLEECRDIVAREKLTTRVFFPGWIGKEDLHLLYQNSNIALISSKAETFGHCIIEPLFYGIPVISTPVGIANDILINNVNGFIYQHNNSEELIKYLSFFYKNRDKIVEFGTKSRYIADSKLTWEVVAEKYRKLIEGMGVSCNKVN